MVSAFSACANNGSDRAVTTTTTITVPPAPRVLVLGDSNLFESGAEVDTALRGAGFEPTLKGVPGYGLKDLLFWLQELDERLDADPDVVAVGLGTNDTGMASEVAQFPVRLDRMMEEIGDRPVIWITHVDDRPAAPATAGRAINAAIRAAPDRWPNLTVLDFTVVMANDPTILSADGLHFTESGRRVYALKITEAVASVLKIL
jgi:lysophospholipase L1-like esterase